MDIGQLIHIGDTVPAGRTQGAGTSDPVGEDYAFARTYDGSETSDTAIGDDATDAESGVLLADAYMAGLIAPPKAPENFPPSTEALAGVVASDAADGAQNDGEAAVPQHRGEPAENRPLDAALPAISFDMPELGTHPPSRADEGDEFLSSRQSEAVPDGTSDKGTEGRFPVAPVSQPNADTTPDAADNVSAKAADTPESTATGVPEQQAIRVAGKTMSQTAFDNPDIAATLANTRSGQPAPGSEVRRLESARPPDERVEAGGRREAEPGPQGKNVPEAGQKDRADSDRSGERAENGSGQSGTAVTPHMAPEETGGTRPPDSTGQPRAATFSGHEIGRQLRDALAGMPDRPVEITLSPDELGRVRMVIATTDGALNLQIIAERPETVDLMRRHADQLAQDLRQMGFDRLDFHFSGQFDGGPGRGFATTPDRVAGPTTQDEEAPLPTAGVRADRSPSPLAAVGRSLDIRL